MCRTCTHTTSQSLQPLSKGNHQRTLLWHRRDMPDDTRHGTVIRFSLRGFVVFTTAVVLAGGLVTFAALRAVAGRESVPRPSSAPSEEGADGTRVSY